MNPLTALNPWRRQRAKAERLYGAIVAQARLPLFYQALGIPDTLEGRFSLLALHLFAVLHRLKEGGDEAHYLSQALSDNFTADMETVLREIGVGDLSIPKKVRGLAASSAALLQGYETAFAAGGDALAEAIEAALPLEGDAAKAAARALATYVQDLIRNLATQKLAKIEAGKLKFPDIIDASGRRLGNWFHDSI